MDTPREVIGFTASGSRIRYSYEVLGASDKEFLAVAMGTRGDVRGNIRTISEENDLTHVVEVCLDD